MLDYFNTALAIASLSFVTVLQRFKIYMALIEQVTEAEG